MKVIYTLTEEQMEKLQWLQNKISNYVYLSHDVVIKDVIADSIIREIFEHIDESCKEMENILTKE